MSQPFLYGKLTDIYTAATLPQSLVVGQQFVDYNNGTMYQLFLAGGTIAANAAFKMNEADATEVIATAAATDGLHGLNCVSGVQVTDGQIFWGNIRGPVTPLVAASQSAGDILAPSGTAGTLTVGSAAAVQQLRCVLQEDSGSGGATAAYLY